MNLGEIERRLKILKEKKVPIMNQRILRGGLRNLNQRKDIRRYGKEIRGQIQSYEKKKLIENQRLIDAQNLLDTQIDGDFKVMSFCQTPEEKFIEPKLKRMRNAGIGWF